MQANEIIRLIREDYKNRKITGRFQVKTYLYQITHSYTVDALASDQRLLRENLMNARRRHIWRDNHDYYYLELVGDLSFDQFFEMMSRYSCASCKKPVSFLGMIGSLMNLHHQIHFDTLSPSESSPTILGEFLYNRGFVGLILSEYNTESFNEVNTKFKQLIICDYC